MADISLRRPRLALFLTVWLVLCRCRGVPCCRGMQKGKDYEDNEKSEDVDREKWELDVDNIDIPAGKLVSVIGQVKGSSTRM